MAVLVITHGVPTDGMEAVSSHTILVPPPLEAFSPARLAALLPDADAVLACGALTGEQIRGAKKLRVIVNYGSGYDGVDVKAATALGIPVANTPDATADATAELAIAQLLAVARRTGELNARMRNEPPASLFGMGRNMGHSLRGSTLGLVGLGRIGRRVAEFGRFMGMRVLYTQRHPDAGADACYEYVPFSTLLSQSDYVSLHCPLTPETRHLLDADALGQMKRGAAVVNTSRGAVIDDAALAAALDAGHLSAAALDVFADEPNVPRCLQGHANVLLTPHIGTNTVEARRRIARDAAERLALALAGKRPPNVVNPEVYGGAGR